MAIDLDERNVQLSTSGYYLIVTGKKSNFEYFGWNQGNLSNGSKNLFAANAGLIVSMNVQGNTRVTKRQNTVSGQQTTGRSTIITTVETYTKNTKTLHKKRSFSFPRVPNIILITSALDSNADKTKIKTFKGKKTYKLRGGGRFAIGDPGGDVVAAIVNNYLAAIEAARQKRNEASTKDIELKTS